MKRSGYSYPFIGDNQMVVPDAESVDCTARAVLPETDVYALYVERQSPQHVACPGVQQRHLIGVIRAEQQDPPLPAVHDVMWFEREQLVTTEYPPDGLVGFQGDGAEVVIRLAVGHEGALGSGHVAHGVTARPAPGYRRLTHLREGVVLELPVLNLLNHTTLTITTRGRVQHAYVPT